MPPTEMQFVLIDETGGATTADGGALTAAILAQIAAACEVQLNRDFAASWGGSYRVRAGASSTDVQPGEFVFAILPTLPAAPGAIAYHAVDGSGVPVLYDAITLSDSLLGAGNSLSVAISHELCETAGDEGANRWADDGQGTEHALETCDAVESQTYAVNSVAVSNFLLPVYFTPGHAGPFDYLSTVGPNTAAPSGPFATTQGGYQITRTSGTNETSSSAASSRRAWRAGSRRARRGVQA